MTYQVPQFIELEDKIVGPLSIRQFGFLAAAFLITLGFFYLFQFWLWLVIAILLWSLAAGLAFVKVNGRSLLVYLFSAFNFYWQPRLFLWQHEIPAPIKVSTPTIRELPLPASPPLSVPLPPPPPVLKPTPPPPPSRPISPPTPPPASVRLPKPAPRKPVPVPAPHPLPPSAEHPPTKYPPAKRLAIPKLELKIPTIIITKKPIFGPSSITTGANLKIISEKLMTTKSAIPKREKPFLWFRRHSGPQYETLRKSTGERITAKRIDYR